MTLGTRRELARERFVASVGELPLLTVTPQSWARLAAANLPAFLSDHAVCEQQAALFALNLVAHYPEDAELVDRMTALASEEILHLRRVIGLLRRRGLRPARRRPNAYAKALHAHIETEAEPGLKVDRLLVGALIEARSCERFTRLLEALRGRDAELTDLLFELGPAERRHWEIFHALARREAEPAWLQQRWQAWLNFESELVRRLGTAPTVHG